MKNKKYMILVLLLITGGVEAGCGRLDLKCQYNEAKREAERVLNAAREAAERAAREVKEAAQRAKEAAERAAKAAKEAAERAIKAAKEAAERAACLAKAGASSAASLSKSLVGKAISIDEFSLEIEVLKPTFKLQAKGAVAGKKFDFSKDIERKGFDGDVQNLVMAQIATAIDIQENVKAFKGFLR